MEASRRNSNGAHNERTHLKNIFAGCASSSISRFFGQPLDIIKVRLQVEKQQRPGQNITVKGAERRWQTYHFIRVGIRDIYFKEGVRGFWRGHSLSQFQGFFHGVGIFWTFEQIRQLFKESPFASSPKLCNFLSGFMTGTVVIAGLNPLEVLHTHIVLRSHDQRIFVLKLVQQLYASYGVRCFFNGGYTTMLHVGSLYGCKFLFYNAICDITLADTDSRGKLPTSFLMTAGAASGVLSHLVTYPLDLVKRRLQVKSSQHLTVYGKPGEHCATIVECCKLVVAHNGFLGFYRGIVPCLLKTAVTTALQFSTYDKLRMWADNHF